MFPLNLLSKSQKYAIAQWLESQAIGWYRERNLNRTEGQRHLEAKNWREAERHFLLALGERRHSSSRTIEMSLGLAKAQRCQNKFSDAEQIVHAAIDLAAKQSSRALQSNALDALAEIQMDRGRFAEAQKTAEENLRLEMAQMKPDKQRLALCFRRIANALAKSGRLHEATANFQKALSYAEKPLEVDQDYGPEHLESADLYTELGTLYRQMGNHSEAQRLLRKALKIHRTVSGIESQEASLDIQYLAVSLEETGDVEGAVKEYERLLNLQQRQVGIVPEESAEAEVRLAALYVKAGRSGPAQELLSHAVSVLEREQGPRLVAALKTLADLQDQLRRPDDARRSRERALSVTLKASATPAP